MVTAGLSALIRDAAAQAARDARQKYDNEHVAANDHVRMLAVVDAVTAVVEPALRSRILELEETLAIMRAEQNTRDRDEDLRLRECLIRAHTALTAPLAEMLRQNLPGSVWDDRVRALLAEEVRS